MWIKDKVVEAMRSFLNIEEANPINIDITRMLDDQATTYKNIIWYNGQTNQLSELYKQIEYKSDTFWGSVPSVGQEIRKIHTGLPALIVDTLTDITMTDYNGLDFNGKTAIEKIWQEIAKENNFEELLKKGTNQGLYKGKGAFKLSLDKEISDYPIIEYYGKDKIEIVKKRGRIREIIFHNYIKQNRKVYLLKETYGYGYVKYNLFDSKGKTEYSLDVCEETKDYENIIFDKSFMMAIPFIINENAIYDKKTDNFDSFDEIYSQWMNALRDGRVKTYIPESLIPRDKNGGYLLKPNPFDNKFIRVESDVSEQGKNEVKVEQPNINVDVYMNTYITALDLCLQGIISPSTLGIDSKKITDPNATAQREKEKTTLWTRGKIVDSISNTIPNLVKVVFYANQTLNKEPLEEIECDVKFGEYANPSFEAQVETIAKAKQGTIMSLETCVDELYGDSKNKEWKKEEVARLKNEQGIVEMEQIPAVNNVLTENNTNIHDENKDNKKEPKSKDLGGVNSGNTK